MKKAIFALAASATLATFAAAVKTTWVDFGTKGPDTYADGTAVAPGAEYRLLYLPAGVTSLADATVCRTATAVALATSGAHCPLTTFQYPIDSKDYVGGMFVTVLGDDSVQSVSIIASKLSSGSLTGSTLMSTAVAPAELAADATAPKITSIRLLDDGVVLLVGGLNVGTYTVEAGTLGGEWTPAYTFSIPDQDYLSRVKDHSVWLGKPETNAVFYRVVAR